ncbi:helix-turn-helix transcriptional regulator [Aeromonas hydrophila]|nr:AlpA family phage regulatory protein [Aeromonas hydrophila]
MRLGLKSVGWLESDVDQWILARFNQADAVNA